MKCILCGTNTGHDSLPYCSGECRVAVSMAARREVPRDIEFVRYETGDYTTMEVAIFFGRVVAAGLHTKLRRQYAAAARSLMELGIVASDGTVDLDRQQQLLGD